MPPVKPDDTRSTLCDHAERRRHLARLFRGPLLGGPRFPAEGRRNSQPFGRPVGFPPLSLCRPRHQGLCPALRTCLPCRVMVPCLHCTALPERGHANSWNAGRWLQLRPKARQFDRIWVGSGRKLLKTGRDRAQRVHQWDALDSHRPIWPRIGQVGADFDQVVADFDHLRSASARDRPISARTRPNQHLPRIDHNWPSFGHTWPEIGQICPEFGQHLKQLPPRLARKLPNLARSRTPHFGQSWMER